VHKVGLDVGGWLAAGLVDTLAAQPLHTPNANYGPSIGDSSMDQHVDHRACPWPAVQFNGYKHCYW
jgi:hypothetical protein